MLGIVTFFHTYSIYAYYNDNRSNRDGLGSEEIQEFNEGLVEGFFEAIREERVGDVRRIVLESDRN